MRNHTLLFSFKQEAKFYCANTDSMHSCPKADPQEQRGFTLHILASRLQKQKARFNPYMVACNSIGYYSPSATWPFLCFNFYLFKFYLSAVPSIPPATLLDTNLSVSFFFSSPPTKREQLGFDLKFCTPWRYVFWFPEDDYTGGASAQSPLWCLHCLFKKHDCHKGVQHPLLLSE
jgi:hypothetical protein